MSSKKRGNAKFAIFLTIWAILGLVNYARTFELEGPDAKKKDVFAIEYAKIATDHMNLPFSTVYRGVCLFRAVKMIIRSKQDRLPDIQGIAVSSLLIRKPKHKLFSSWWFQCARGLKMMWAYLKPPSGIESNAWYRILGRKIGRGFRSYRICYNLRSCLSSKRKRNQLKNIILDETKYNRLFRNSEDEFQAEKTIALIRKFSIKTKLAIIPVEWIVKVYIVVNFLNRLLAEVGLGEISVEEGYNLLKSMNRKRELDDWLIRASKDSKSLDPVTNLAYDATNLTPKENKKKFQIRTCYTVLWDARKWELTENRVPDIKKRLEILCTMLFADIPNYDESVFQENYDTNRSDNLRKILGRN